MKYLILNLLLLYYSAYAQKAKVHTFDNNKDGKMDSFYSYTDSKLTKVSLDINYDGKIDYVKTFASNDFYYVERSDLDFNGTFDRIKKTKLINNQILISEFVQTKKEEKLVKMSLTPIIHSDVNACFEKRDNLLNDISRLIGTFDKVVSTYDSDEFNHIDSIKYDKACSKKFGKRSFPKLLSKIQNEGLACLTKLADKSKDSNKQVELFNLLNRMNIELQTDEWKVTISCSQDDSFKKSKDQNSVSSHRKTIAKASIADVEINNLKHPLILLNPDLETGWGGNISEDELKSTIFHEMIHNYGYGHGDNFDLAYGCEVCCFGDEFPDEAKAPACNICTGNYEDESDSNYLKDISLLRYHTGLVVGENLVINKFRQTENTPIFQASFFAFFHKLHPDVLRNLNKITKTVSKQSNEVLLPLVSQFNHGSEVLERNSVYFAELINAIFFERDKVKILDTYKKIDKLKDIYQIDDFVMNFQGLNRRRPGGDKFIKDLKSILLIASKDETDPDLKKLYNNQLILLFNIEPTSF